MALTLAYGVSELKDKLKPFLTGENPAFTDEELGRAIDRAVKVYGRHRPNNTAVDFTLVSGTQTYSWPSQAKNILPFFFSNTVEAVTDLSGTPIVDPALFDFESPASDVRAKTYLARFRKDLLGTVSVDRATKKFSVWPIPAEGKVVKLPIVIAHEKTGAAGSETYITVLDEDADYVIQWAQADCLEIIAVAFSSQNKKIGDRDYRGSFTYRDLIAYAETLKESFYAHLSRPVSGRS